MRMAGLATFGLTLLNTQNVLGNVFESKRDDLQYHPSSPETNDLRKSGYNVPAVSVQGVIYDKDSMQELSNVKVEVWHLSPDSEEVSYRAHFFTATNGSYQFITDFPGHAPRLKPRIFFRLSNGKKERFSELIFDTHFAYLNNEQWEHNKSNLAQLTPKLSKKLGIFSIQNHQTL